MNESPFGVGDGGLDGMELLGDVEAGSLVLKHRDDALEMPYGPAQALGDLRVRCMGMRLGHEFMVSPWKGYTLAAMFPPWPEGFLLASPEDCVAR